MIFWLGKFRRYTRVQLEHLLFSDLKFLAAAGKYESNKFQIKCRGSITCWNAHWKLWICITYRPTCTVESLRILSQQDMSSIHNRLCFWWIKVFLMTLRRMTNCLSESEKRRWKHLCHCNILISCEVVCLLVCGVLTTEWDTYHSCPQRSYYFMYTQHMPAQSCKIVGVRYIIRRCVIILGFYVTAKFRICSISWQIVVP